MYISAVESFIRGLEQGGSHSAAGPQMEPHTYLMKTSWKKFLLNIYGYFLCINLVTWKAFSGTNGGGFQKELNEL